MTESSRDFNSTPELDCEGWRDVVRSLCGRYTPGGIEPETFSGRARPGSICDFVTVDLIISCSAHRVEQTNRDVRHDGMEDYYAVIRSPADQRWFKNDRVEELAVGDIALVDAAPLVTYFLEQARPMAQSASAAPGAAFPFWIRAGRWFVQAWRNTCKSPLFPSHSGCR